MAAGAKVSQTMTLKATLVCCRRISIFTVPRIRNELSLASQMLHRRPTDTRFLIPFGSSHCLVKLCPAAVSSTGAKRYIEV